MITRLELTWVGKEDQTYLEPYSLLEDQGLSYDSGGISEKYKWRGGVGFRFYRIVKS